MKKSILFICFLLPLALFAQQGEFVLKGKLGTLSVPTKVYLTYRQEQATITDSTVLKNGVFEFKGKVADPLQAWLLVDHERVGLINIMRRPRPDMLVLYLENGNLILSSSSDSISKADITGSIVNADNKIFKTLSSNIEAKRRALNAEYAASPIEKKQSKDFQDYLGKRNDSIESVLNELRTQFIKKNPSSFKSLFLIKDIGGAVPDEKIIEPLFNGLSEQIRNSVTGKELVAKIAKLKLVAVGGTAPDFTQNDVNGKPVKLSDFKGKYVLLDFWASWCVPCRKENPNVLIAYNRFKEKGFTVLGVSLDSENQKEAWLKAIEKDGLVWTQVSDLKGWRNEPAKLYVIQSIPQNFLINPEGKIIAKNLRGEELNKKLEEIFK